MTVNWMVSLLPLFEMADATGGASGTGAATDTGGTGGTGATDNSGEVATPHVIEVSDENALVRYPGAKEPVPFKNLRNFQAQWTKEAQRRAKVEQQLAERDARLQQYERERQAAATRQAPGNQQEDIFAKLNELPYLSGEQAAQVVQSIAQQINQRDRVMYGMAQKMQEMYQRLTQVYDSHTNSSFDSKINGLLEQSGYGSDYADLAKDIYLAYEGEDLDIEFPSILKQRIEQVERLAEKRRTDAAQRRRANAFVPGRGGAAGPSAPITFKGDESPAAIADTLWGAFKESGT